MLLRLSYLALTNMVAFVRLLAMSDVDKDVEILALRHQLAVLQHQIGRPGPDWAFLAALLHRLTLRQPHLIRRLRSQVGEGLQCWPHGGACVDATVVSGSTSPVEIS